MEVRVGIAIAVLIVLTGCNSGAKKTARTDAQTTSRIELCTQRFVDRIKGDRGPNIRSYVKRTYCGPFARNGWVYADGTLSIKAHLSVLNGGSCKAVSTTPGGRTTTMAFLIFSIRFARLRPRVRGWSRRCSPRAIFTCCAGTSNPTARSK